MKALLTVVSLLFGIEALGADITSNQILFGFSETHPAPRVLEKDHQKWGTSLNILDGIKLLPSKPAKGRSSSLAVSYEYGLGYPLTLGTSIAVQQESLVQDQQNFPSTSSPNIQGEIYLKYKIWQDQVFNASVIPFLETGYADANHFSYASKTRAGAILSGLYEITDTTTIEAGIHYRYRPAEVHGNYRVASDFGWSIQPNYFINKSSILSLEYSQVTGSILNINKPGNRYWENQNSTLALSYRYDWLNNSLEASYGKGLNSEATGNIDHMFQLSYSQTLAMNTPQAQPDSPRDNMSPGERVYWLDQLRKNMARRNQNIGNELKGFQLNEGQQRPMPVATSPQEDIQAADKTIKELQIVDKKITKKKNPEDTKNGLASKGKRSEILESEPAQLPVHNGLD